MHDFGFVLLVENPVLTPPLFFGFAAVKLGARLVAGMFALWHEHSRLSAANPKNKEYLFVSDRATYSTKPKTASGITSSKTILKESWRHSFERAGTFWEIAENWS